MYVFTDEVTEQMHVTIFINQHRMLKNIVIPLPMDASSILMLSSQLNIRYHDL